MRLLNKLLELHDLTKSDWIHNNGLKGLAHRMYCEMRKLQRIGKNTDSINRDDISSNMILRSYLARKVYVNEKNLRGGYKLKEVYDCEVKFTTGLWNILCEELFGTSMPELPVPCTYKEVKYIFDHKDNKSFSIYKTATEVLLHSTLTSKIEVKSLADFDEKFLLEKGSTRVWAARNSYIPRTEPDLNLIRCSMGLFRYDYLKFDEPYKNFWKERAHQAIEKIYSQGETAFIRKFMNADTFDLSKNNQQIPDIKIYQWYR